MLTLVIAPTNSEDKLQAERSIELQVGTNASDSGRMVETFEDNPGRAAQSNFTSSAILSSNGPSVAQSTQPRNSFKTASPTKVNVIGARTLTVSQQRPRVANQATTRMKAPTIMRTGGQARTTKGGLWKPTQLRGDHKGNRVVSVAHQPTQLTLQTRTSKGFPSGTTKTATRVTQPHATGKTSQPRNYSEGNRAVSIDSRPTQSSSIIRNSTGRPSGPTKPPTRKTQMQTAGKAVAVDSAPLMKSRLIEGLATGTHEASTSTGVVWKSIPPQK
ncbi:hypothetical protein PM082_009523 [Marasmius tenuissimus]|nr:hypothetical protein PM082_009523 [Marasmius tenuissimus]